MLARQSLQLLNEVCSYAGRACGTDVGSVHAQPKQPDSVQKWLAQNCLEQAYGCSLHHCLPTRWQGIAALPENSIQRLCMLLAPCCCCSRETGAALEVVQ